MSIAITQEQHDLADSIRDWASRTGPRTVLRGGHSAEHAAPELSTALAELGLFGIAVPEKYGGANGSVVDLAVGLEQAAAELVPGAVCGTALAGLLLAEVTGSPAGQQLLARLVDGEARAAVAADAVGEVTGSRTAEGDLVLQGRLDSIPEADSETHLLLPVTVEEQVVWCVLAPDTPGSAVSTQQAFDLSRGVATVELDGAAVEAGAVLTELASARVRDLALTLNCAEAAGVAGECVRVASEYAKVREQFARPIGAFQAVKHMCAEMLCRSELAGALAWDAARAAPEPEQNAIAAATAAAYVFDAAVDNAKDCIQVLGGIGFTWEHDAHLYLRRALALRQRFGGSTRWRRATADQARHGTRRDLELDMGEYGEAGFAERVRAVATEIAELPEPQRRARLAESGYQMPHWPAPYGLDAGPAEQLVIDAELERAGVTRPDLVIGAWAVPTILRHGTPQQQRRLAEPTLRGEIVWCQLFSEPGAGSDLASLRTSARRTDGGWVLSGQKVWTSLADRADWAICLARTNPEVPKHRGITYFLVRMDAPGITVRGLREITGEAVFNEVFLDEVFVPDDDVVGEIDGGWKLARTTLANERVSLSSDSSIGEGMERLLAGNEEDGVEPDKLGALVTQGYAVSLLELRATLRSLAGGAPGAESSVSKLVSVRHRQEVAEVSLEQLGSTALAVNDSTASTQHEFLMTRCLSIAGGTTQVLLNVAAERLLGLPRS